LIESVAVPPLPRKPTKPTRSSQQRRLETKATRSDVKRTRSKVAAHD